MGKYLNETNFILFHDSKTFYCDFEYTVEKDSVVIKEITNIYNENKSPIVPNDNIYGVLKEKVKNNKSLIDYYTNR